jgi:ankyrin repeat protein
MSSRRVARELLEAGTTAGHLLPSLVSLGVGTSAGVDVDARDDWSGKTPLHLACCNNDAKRVKRLLKADASLDTRDAMGDTPLHAACERGHTDCVEPLLQAGAGVNTVNNFGDTPLHAACTNGSECCVRLLLAERTELRMNVCNRNQHAPLHAACIYDHAGCAKLLLAAGADVNVGDRISPLHLACYWDHLECARLLLEAGASVNAKDASGRTALHHTCRHGAVKCGRLLLKAGADVDPRMGNDDGNTPLLVACWHRYPDCVRLLLEAGARTDARNLRGNTLREMAEIFYEELLGNGADVDAYRARDCGRLVERAERLREERGVPAGAPLPLDWTESTHRLLLYEHRRLLHRALGALLLVDARREGGATLGREGALAFVAAFARVAGV